MTEYNMIDGYDPFYTGEPVEQIPPYIVYVKLDENNLIEAVNSSAFLRNTDGWTEIDRGYTQNHHHAQGNYFDKMIYDDRGIKHYKLVDGKPVERTQEEMDADWVEPIVQPDPKDVKIAELEEKLAAVSAAVLQL